MKYSIKVNEIRNGSGNIRGVASVTLGDSFKLNNITIVNDPREQGKVFVSMPSYKTQKTNETNNQMDVAGQDGQEEYKNIFHPITKEFHDELYDNILGAFHELTENQAKNSYTVEYNKKDTQMPDFKVRVTPYEREGSSIRGMASITLGGMAINNVKIHQGQNGLFVSMPSYKTSQTDEQGKAVYKDVCHPITGKFRDKLYGAILQEYETAKEAQEQTNAKDSVLDKLNENKEAAAQKESAAKSKDKSKGKEHEQHSREDAR